MELLRHIGIALAYPDDDIYMRYIHLDTDVRKKKYNKRRYFGGVFEYCQGSKCVLFSFVDFLYMNINVLQQQRYTISLGMFIAVEITFCIMRNYMFVAEYR